MNAFEYITKKIETTLYANKPSLHERNGRHSAQDIEGG